VAIKLLKLMWILGPLTDREGVRRAHRPQAPEVHTTDVDTDVSG
jgi:hypothetical protein